MRRVHFVHAATGQAICRAEVAETFVSRFAGLQGRRTLPQDAAMWIVPTRSIHTFWMRFAIDALALDDQMRVVEWREALRPWQVAQFRATSHSVLELAAGRLHQVGVSVGDLLRVEQQ